MFPYATECVGRPMGHHQPQQLHTRADFGPYTLTSSTAYHTNTPPQQQALPQQQQQQRPIGNTSTLIDPPVTYMVSAPQQQQQQQQLQTAQALCSSYPQNARASTTSMAQDPSNANSGSNNHRIPLYTPAGTPANLAGQGQRLSNANSANAAVPTQRLQPVFLSSAAAPTVTSPLLPSPHHQQQPWPNSAAANAVYSPLTRQSQQQQPATPPSSFGATTQPGMLHPLSGIPTSASNAQLLTSPHTPSSMTSPASAVLRGGNNFRVNTPSSSLGGPALSAFSAAPSQLLPGGTVTASDGASLGDYMPGTFLVASQASQHHGIVDADEMRQARERSFRFKMLPPPPTFDRFVQQWEANAVDANSRPWRRGESSSNIAAIAGQQPSPQLLMSDTSGNTFQNPTTLNADAGFYESAAGADAEANANTALKGEEDATRRHTTADAATPTTANARSVEERLAMAEQYRRILERWWSYIAIFENKSEVRQRLGNLYQCPTYEDAQRATHANNVDGSMVDSKDPLSMEAVLQTWSHLVQNWWEETKRRRRTRRSRRGTRKETSSSAKDGLADDARGDVTPNANDDEAVSTGSGNSYGLPDTDESRFTRSLPDNEAYLNFDFTNQTTFGSPAESV